MSYSIDEIYKQVGRDDKVAVLTFHPDSEAKKQFGKDLTVVFVYDLIERESLEQKFLDNVDDSSVGYINAENLDIDFFLSEAKIPRKIKINTADIESIFPSTIPHNNLFYSKEKRQITTLKIPFQQMDNGRDFDWIYGFTKKRIKEGIGLPPREILFYYAAKLYYEPENLTEDDKRNIYLENGTMNSEIELEYLRIKIIRKEASKEERIRAQILVSERKDQVFQLMSNELNSAGTSIKKLYAENPELAEEIYSRAIHFKDRHLNISGKNAIYLDLKAFFHIYLRHVIEFQVSGHFKGKTNFQWDEEDVIMIMEKVISSIDEDIQAYWLANPGKRFSKYGRQALYFEGDYYTFHIEGDGRLSTFHKSNKQMKS